METRKFNTGLEPSAHDWWQLRLFGVIRDFHPRMLTPEQEADTLEFIVLRAAAARRYYEARMLEGVPHFFALEEARAEVLTAGLA